MEYRLVADDTVGESLLSQPSLHSDSPNLSHVQHLLGSQFIVPLLSTLVGSPLSRPCSSEATLCSLIGYPMVLSVDSLTPDLIWRTKAGQGLETLS